MSAVQKRRVEWVDIGKYLCIMAVMLSHLESGSVWLSKIYMPFYLTGFFFLSGYVYSQPESFKVHITKKAKGLLIPWFVFSHLNIVLSHIISFRESGSFWEEVGWNWLQIRGEGDGLWFVAALFVAYIPFYYFIKAGKPKVVLGISFVLAVIQSVYIKIDPLRYELPWGSSRLPWHLEYIFYAMFWMILGYYFKLYGEKYFEKYFSTVVKIVIIAVFFGIVFYPFRIPSVYGRVALTYVREILGVLSLITVSKSVHTNRYFAFVGANTLTYFGLHGKVFAVLQKLMSVVAGDFYKMILRNEVYSSIFAIVLTLILSVILIIPAMLINRYCPWILGRSSKR